MLERLRQQRAAKRARLDDLLNITGRDPSTDELREIDDLLDQETGIPALDARIARLEDDEKREARAAASRAETNQTATERGNGTTTARVTSEPETYRKNGENSYFRDLVFAQAKNDRSAIERLARNDREMQERALSTVDGAGGEFVPPQWMIGEFVTLARAARVTADRVRQQTLPAGTDSINVPTLATGTAVAEQSTQNTAVQNTDATTGSLTAAVATIAGQQVVALQLVEQSPVNLDQILLADLAADYATKLDVYVLNNNATGKKGLLKESGTTTTTYTDASPTVGELYSKLASAVASVHTSRFLPPDAIVMHPRRWAWMLAATDANQRPLITPYSGVNAVGSTGGVVSEGLVGNVMGLPVYVDPNLPINLGSGTNEDRIIVARFSDSILWESNPRAEAFRETKADQLSVLLRFYNYAAFTAARYPGGISIVSGTGLVTPTF